MTNTTTEEVAAPIVKKKYKKNYINNGDFTAAIVEWKKELQTNPSARMSEYIGMCFMKLVEGCSKKANFAGYTYLDEMKGEAILTCIKYAHNFDPAKSSNAFGYFTQSIHNAFIQVLNDEKKISDKKFRYIKEVIGVSEKYDYSSAPDAEEY